MLNIHSTLFFKIFRIIVVFMLSILNKYRCFLTCKALLYNINMIN